MVEKGKLDQINPVDIGPNPDNPRLIFHEEDMNRLLVSIKEFGIRVPITVYENGSKFTIIDGERRWRCAKKLNLKTMPAIIHPKPDKLENILTMFNIHNVRVDWDLMPAALKLKEVKSLLEKKEKKVTKQMLASLTGMSVTTVNRCLQLLDLPKQYQDALLLEAQKPRSQQTLTVDLFLEIMKSRSVVERYAPDVFKKVDKKEYVDSFRKKYEEGTIGNVVKFRDVAKIARGESKGIPKEKVVSTIVKLVKDPHYNIQDAFKDSLEHEYRVRDITRKVESIIQSLTELNRRDLPSNLTALLQRLKELIERLI